VASTVRLMKIWEVLELGGLCCGYAEWAYLGRESCIERATLLAFCISFPFISGVARFVRRGRNRIYGDPNIFEILFVNDAPLRA
jgi:hypothetical protein